MCPRCKKSTYKISLSEGLLRCKNCGLTDLGHFRALKGWKTRRKTLKTAPRTHGKRLLGSVLVVWALGVILAIPAFAFESTVEYKRAVQDLEKVRVILVDMKEQLEKKPETPGEVREYILAEAKEVGVHIAKIEFMVKNESKFDRHAKGDMNIICPNKNSPAYGKPVEARGPWQITRCWFPQISDVQAYDPVWSTDWALSIISKSKKDCIQLWSTCRKWHTMNGTM